MPDGSLNVEARRENVRALALAAGLSEEEASARLDEVVLFTHDEDDPVAYALAAELIPILSRTLSVTSDPTRVESHIAVELIVGNANSRTLAKKVYVGLASDRIVIQSVPTRTTSGALPHRLMVLIAACYVAGATVNAAVGVGFSCAPHFDMKIRFDAFFPQLAYLTEPIECGESFLAGAGAIGNGLLWAARHVTLVGKLNIVDDDVVSPGNLQRQVWFNSHDIGKPKAQRLAALAQPFANRCEFVPAVCRLQEHPARTDGAWLPRLIVAVDSRSARRHLQNELPGEVFDASTTGSQEIVLHYNKQPSKHACLGCVYPRDDAEVSHEQAIADHLGIDLEAACQERISPEIARRICETHQQLSPTHIEGLAFDTLYKQLCGSAQLKSISGKQVIAPLAFVSVLAGALLLLEMIGRLKRLDFPPTNEWRVNPWVPPIPQLRYLRPNREDCECCSRGMIKAANARLWGAPVKK